MQSLSRPSSFLLILVAAFHLGVQPALAGLDDVVDDPSKSFSRNYLPRKKGCAARIVSAAMWATVAAGSFYVGHVATHPDPELAAVRRIVVDRPTMAVQMEQIQEVLAKRAGADGTTSPAEAAVFMEGWMSMTQPTVMQNVPRGFVDRLFRKPAFQTQAVEMVFDSYTYLAVRPGELLLIQPDMDGSYDVSGVWMISKKSEQIAGSETAEPTVENARKLAEAHSELKTQIDIWKSEGLMYEVKSAKVSFPGEIGTSYFLFFYGVEEAGGAPKSVVKVHLQFQSGVEAKIDYITFLKPGNYG